MVDLSTRGVTLLILHCNLKIARFNNMYSFFLVSWHRRCLEFCSIRLIGDKGVVMRYPRETSSISCIIFSILFTLVSNRRHSFIRCVRFLRAVAWHCRSDFRLYIAINHWHLVICLHCSMNPTSCTYNISIQHKGGWQRKRGRNRCVHGSPHVRPMLWWYTIDA